MNIIQKIKNIQELFNKFDKQKIFKQIILNKLK